MRLPSLATLTPNSPAGAQALLRKPLAATRARFGEAHLHSWSQTDTSRPGTELGPPRAVGDHPVGEVAGSVAKAGVGRNVFIHFLPADPLVMTTAIAPGCSASPVRSQPIVFGWSK